MSFNELKMTRREKPGDVTMPNGDIVVDATPGNESWARWGPAIIPRSRLKRAEKFRWRKVEDLNDGRRVVVRRDPLHPGFAGPNIYR